MERVPDPYKLNRLLCEVLGLNRCRRFKLICEVDKAPRVEAECLVSEDNADALVEVIKTLSVIEHVDLRKWYVCSTPLDEQTPDICRQANGYNINSEDLPHDTGEKGMPCRCVLVPEQTDE